MQWLIKFFKSKKITRVSSHRIVEGSIKIKPTKPRAKSINYMANTLVQPVEGFAELFNENFADEEWVKIDDWPDEETFEKIELKCIPKLPKPNAGFEIYQSIQNPDTPAKEIAEKVTRDPSLVALILKEVNSAYYGFNYVIEEIGRAVVLLGYNEVKSIVLANSINAIYSKDQKSQEIIKHSRLVALIAFQLANKTQSVNPHLMSTFGMLHDIGQVFLEPLKAELEEFHLSDLTSQILLGIFFIHHWKLPLDFGPWLQKFSQGKEDAEAPVAILGVANYVANLLKQEDLWPNSRPPESWFGFLKLSKDPKEWFNNKEQMEIMRTLLN